MRSKLPRLSQTDCCTLPDDAERCEVRGVARIGKISGHSELECSLAIRLRIPLSKS